MGSGPARKNDYLTGMKKKYLIAGLLFITACAQRSNVAEERLIDQAVTIDDAYSLSEKYPILTLYSLNSTKDTSKLDQQLYKLKIGEITHIDGGIYKAIKDTGNFTLRASYIYLDGAHLTLTQVDSLRDIIRKKYAAGTSFEELVDKYNMDPNTKHGDTGPFQAGMMVREFEEAVRTHTKGDIFTVDVPEKKWYYVVKKTADNEGETIRIVLGFNKEKK